MTALAIHPLGVVFSIVGYTILLVFLTTYYPTS